MTHKYRPYDAESGQFLSAEFGDVIASKALSSVNVASGSNEITVASTADVYPFMGLSVPFVPLGSFVLAVKSSTVILAARLLDRPDAWLAGATYAVGDTVFFAEQGQIYRCTVAHTAGSVFVTDYKASKWTLVSDPLIVPALATDSASGMTGHAHGFNPVPIPELVYDGRTYRNEWPLSYKGGTAKWMSTQAGGTQPLTAFTGPLAGGPIIHPEALANISGSPEELSWTHLRMVVPDTMAGIPPRPEPSWVSYWHFVHTGGLLSKFPARAGVSIIHTGSAA